VPVIFSRSLAREFAQLASVVAAVLLAITFTTQIIRLLGKAAGGSLPADAVAIFLGFMALNYLPVVLSLSLFIAVLFTLTRAYRDSEMIVWFSLGKGLTDFVRPVFWFALPIVAVVAVLTLFLSPWALKKAGEFQTQIDARSDISRVSSGVFRESKRSNMVFFVETVDPKENRIENVFVQWVQHQQLGVAVAKSGYQEAGDNGEKYLVLLDGRRYDGTPGAADYKITDFERASIRIADADSSANPPNTRSLTPAEIWREPNAERLAELHWRIGLPVSVMVLALLAIPMSYVNPRAGRSWNLILAILVYTIYSNLLSIAQAWTAQGKLSPMVGAWPVHGLMLLIMLVMFAWRSGALPRFSLRRRAVAA
jgi:lipopolysaccharide export system permease protein